MTASLRLPPLMEPEDQSRYWALRLLDALGGALLMWVYAEAFFVAAGVLWREFLGGFPAFLILSSLLVAASPLAAAFTAAMLGCRRPWDCARWACWPAGLFLAWHLTISMLFREQIAVYRDLGFAQFCDTGAWVGVFVGFFAGLAFEPPEPVEAAPLASGERLRNAAAGLFLAGASWFLLGGFLHFSWLRFSGDPDVHLYFTLFLLLGAPFYCAGLSEALGAARPERAAVLSVLPTFAILYLVVGGGSALVDPAQADALIGRLPWLGLGQGAACGLLSGLSYRPRNAD